MCVCVSNMNTASALWFVCSQCIVGVLQFSMECRFQIWQLLFRFRSKLDSLHLMMEFRHKIKYKLLERIMKYDTHRNRWETNSCECVICEGVHIAYEIIFYKILLKPHGTHSQTHTRRSRRAQHHLSRNRKWDTQKQKKNVYGTRTTVLYTLLEWIKSFYAHSFVVAFRFGQYTHTQ